MDTELAETLIQSINDVNIFDEALARVPLHDDMRPIWEKRRTQALETIQRILER